MADSIWTAAKNDDFRARRDSNFVVDNSDSSVEYGRFICGIEVWRDGFKFCCACIDQFEDGFDFQSLAMRAHGEVMGADRSLPVAFAKAQMAAGVMLPTSGKVFLSVRESDKRAAIDIARSLIAAGFTLICSRGTHEYLATNGVKCDGR